MPINLIAELFIRWAVWLVCGARVAGVWPMCGLLSVGLSTGDCLLIVGLSIHEFVGS